MVCSNSKRRKHSLRRTLKHILIIMPGRVPMGFFSFVFILKHVFLVQSLQRQRCSLNVSLYYLCVLFPDLCSGLQHLPGTLKVCDHL